MFAPRFLRNRWGLVPSIYIYMYIQLPSVMNSPCPFFFFSSPTYTAIRTISRPPWKRSDVRTHTHDSTISDHESSRMVTVSFDFSQIPAQWVARNSCGKKVVKSVGREESPLLPGGVASFLPKSAFLSATFLISVSAFSRGGRVAVTSRNDSCGKSIALGGKRKISVAG